MLIAAENITKCYGKCSLQWVIFLYLRYKQDRHSIGEQASRKLSSRTNEEYAALMFTPADDTDGCKALHATHGARLAVVITTNRAPLFYAILTLVIAFFGRQQIVSRYIDAIKRYENRGIFGVRKTGKTSLLFKLDRIIREQNLGFVFFYDFKSPSYRKLHWNELLGEICDDIDTELSYYFRHVVSEIQQFYPEEYEMFEILASGKQVILQNYLFCQSLSHINIVMGSLKGIIMGYLMSKCL